MSKKHIISVGIEIPGDLTEELEYDSGRTLMDGDIIIFSPVVRLYSSGTYQGKTCLNDDRSVALRENAAHWKREMSDAINVGKTVFIFLCRFQDCYIGTGTRSYSGTGRNRQETRHVGRWNNYENLPVNLEAVASKGREMKLSSDSDIIKSLWSELNEFFNYEIYLQNKDIKPLITTTHGKRVVAGIYNFKSAQGTLVLLPNIDFDREDFVETHVDDEGKKSDFYTKEALVVGHKLVNSLCEIDKIVKQSVSLTPSPEWSSLPEFILKNEQKLQQEILQHETEISRIDALKEKLKEDLNEEGLLRCLLFEKGKVLERAIIKALQILGFKAHQYQDSNSEFDVVFESADGRMLGESEGKDDKAIDISKMRQLEMNVLEDLEREEISSPAKAVLFGNAFRLKKMAERGEFFTEKCIKAAKRNGTALVRTPDLFFVAKQLLENPNEKLAHECRRAIFETAGEIVTFPRLSTLNVDKIVTELVEEPTSKVPANNKLMERKAESDRSS